MYNTTANINNLEDIAGTKKNLDKDKQIKDWNPLPTDWLKWNTNASRLKINTHLPWVLSAEIISDRFTILVESDWRLSNSCRGNTCGSGGGHGYYLKGST